MKKPFDQSVATSYIKEQYRFRKEAVLLFLLSSLILSLFFATNVLLAKEVDSGINLKQQLFQEHRYVEATLDLEKVTLIQKWVDDSTAKSYGSFYNFQKILKAKNQSILFAMNSGIYTDDYKPLGLYIEDKQVLAPLNLVTSNEGKGNFSLLPNGVFYITDQNLAEIQATMAFHEKYQGNYEEIQSATQSGPMLLIDGEYNPHFIPDSTSTRIRSGVCAIDNGKKVIFVVTEDSVSFYEFARYFKEILSCDNALYLDGTLARMFVDKRVYGASFWQAKPLVGIWTVLENQKE
ncbi:phosphodiester glycosidase family protein [Ignatzschineria sp. LJL83]